MSLNLPYRPARSRLRSFVCHASSLATVLSALTLAACGGGDGNGAGPASTQGSSRAQAQAASPASNGGVIINEVIAGNWQGARDADGDAEDWVELYNPGDTFVELTGYGLSNKTASPFLWTFPAGTKIPAKGYLTVWLSKKDRAVLGAPLHTSFNLDSGADGVYLTASNATATGVPIDNVTPPLLRADQSWCRMPSGAASSPFMACDQSTQGQANAGTAYPAILAKPTVTPASGFYAAAQTVTLTGPAGATLRYTTDGSEPTATSTAYAAPLNIGANTVLRVAAFATGSAPSLVETATYVINAAQASQYAGLKAMMVAIPPGDYTAFQANDQTREFRASFELIAGGVTSVFKMDGEGSAGGQLGSGDSPQRTMNVKGIDAFGPKAFPGVLWANKPGVKSVRKFRLRNGSNDWASAHLRDQLSQKLGADGPNLWSSSTSVAMFVNGTYYGLMDLREREEETLPSSNLGIDKDYIDYIYDPLLGAQEIKNGGSAALASYQAMHNYIVGNDMSVAANYAQARTLMNPESLAWDWALHMFHANYDWPGRNVHVWRSPEVDGRWTWRAHDMDFAFARYTDVNYNMNGSFAANGSQVIAGLLRNTDFRNLYLNAVADQLNVMTPAYMNATLDTMSAEMRPYIADFYAKNGLGAASVWEGNLGAIRTWFSQREAVYDGHNQAQFGLGARQTLNVSVNDTVMGSVKVNLVDTQKYVTAANPTWTGRYYPGVPVTLEARPKPGYTFVGWQGASTATTRRITQTVSATTQLTAVFAAAGTPAAPTIAAFAAQARSTGDLVALPVSATDPGGFDITYSAKTLPKGLNINPANGMIFGKLTTPGVYKTTVSVTNGVATGTATIDWTVTDRAGTGLLGTSPDNGVSTMNTPPTVALVSPLANANVATGTTINLSATAADVDGTIAKVDYYDGANLIGTATASPFAATWSGGTVGSHVLTARATDSGGAATTSAPVAIYVGTPSPTPPANAVTCATEGQLCVLPVGVSATVWYGANTSWAVKSSVAGTISCTNDVFTDPLVGTVKSCRYLASTAPANNAPTVTLTAPAGNTTIAQGSAIALAASASDTDGTIAKVEFYDGSTLVGTDTTAPYTFTLSNAVLGSHVLTARAYDNAGTLTVSAAVTVTVVANQAPTVAITAPGANASVVQGTAIALAATAADADGSVAKVEYFDGTTLVGSATAAPWSANWANAAVGTHTLTARAIDNLGGTTISSAVSVVVTAATNTPPANAVGCSSEGGTCTLPAGATATVWYGANTSWILKTGVTGSIACTNAVFTDPLYGTVKACRYAVTTTPPTNTPPTVAITAPANNASVLQGTVITLTASATDNDGTVAKVDYLDGTTVVGTATAAPWSVNWSNAALGRHTLTARATDNTGTPATSAPVTLTVTAPTNTPPANAVACASEGGTCALPAGATAIVWYGASSSWVSKTGITGSIACTNAVFTDPLVGTVKACRYVVTASAGTGLTGSYFSNTDLTGTAVLTRTEAPWFDWGTGSPAAAVPTDNFSVRWTGQVQAVEAGNYQFRTNSDDGVRVWINGVLVINNWTVHAPIVDTSATIALASGQRVPIVVEFQEFGGGAVLQLSWLRPAGAWAQLPSTQLYP